MRLYEPCRYGIISSTTEWVFFKGNENDGNVERFFEQPQKYLSINIEILGNMIVLLQIQMGCLTKHVIKFNNIFVRRQTKLLNIFIFFVIFFFFVLPSGVI